MASYPFCTGPFDKGVTTLKSYGSKLVSIPEYIDKKTNIKIPQDPSEGYIRTKESFIYVPILSNINHPQIELPDKPGGVWFNTESPLIELAEEATKKHRDGFKFRLNGQINSSLEGAINHYRSFTNLPIDSIQNYDITKKIFGKGILKYQEILDSLGIKNINLKFYDLEEVNNGGYSFADQALVYLD